MEGPPKQRTSLLLVFFATKPKEATLDRFIGSIDTSSAFTIQEQIGGRNIFNWPEIESRELLLLASLRHTFWVSTATSRYWKGKSLKG